MPLREEITYILVHDRLPNHRKIRGLSDPAFRLLIEAWCYCGENHTDGRITADVWATMRTKNARQELVDKQLVDVLDNGDVDMHDYLDIQRSTAEIEQATASKVAGGVLGNHRRWHLNRRKSDPKCPLCLKAAS